MRMDEAYCGHGKKHNDKLFLVEYWMADDSVDKARKASTSLLQKQGICCDRIAVDCLGY